MPAPRRLPSPQPTTPPFVAGFQRLSHVAPGLTRCYPIGDQPQHVARRLVGQPEVDLRAAVAGLAQPEPPPLRHAGYTGGEVANLTCTPSVSPMSRSAHHATSRECSPRSAVHSLANECPFSGGERLGPTVGRHVRRTPAGGSYSKRVRTVFTPTGSDETKQGSRRPRGPTSIPTASRCSCSRTCRGCGRARCGRCARCRRGAKVRPTSGKR